MDHVLIDDGDIAPNVRGIVPAGVELALELVGTPTLPDTLRATAIHGDARDLPAVVLQAFLDAVAAGRLAVPVHRTYRLDEIVTAHADMEAGRATGQLVVLPRPTLQG